MSVRVVFVATLALAVIGQAFEDVAPDNERHVYEPASADRYRRVTCDLVSVETPIGTLNHDACAAHCLAVGSYRGGRCIDGVCNCRR